MPYPEDPAPCPKCGETCVLRVLISQERENTCPQCNFKFVDAREQFQSTYVGLFHEGGDMDSPPMALFKDQETYDLVVELMKNSANEDIKYDAHNGIPMDCSVYGCYWNDGVDPSPYENFTPFVPEHIAEQYTPKTPGLEVTVEGEDVELELSMRQELVIHGALIYFCKNNRRWYAFYRHNDVLGRISINDTPGNFHCVYMSGVIGGMVRGSGADNKPEFLSWDEYRKGGGYIVIVPGEAHDNGTKRD